MSSSFPAFVTGSAYGKFYKHTEKHSGGAWTSENFNEKMVCGEIIESIVRVPFENIELVLEDPFGHVAIRISKPCSMVIKITDPEEIEKLNRYCKRRRDTPGAIILAEAIADLKEIMNHVSQIAVEESARVREQQRQKKKRKIDEK